ncbi:MAG: DUF4469 domain-containing protein [Treponema sp.]|jgi:hypothetical protein|nr:DUF4469 domain-containing protein [Treponema sp.]
MLEYTPEDGEAAEGPEEFRVRAVNVAPYTQNDIVERILRVCGGLTRSEVVSVLEAEKQAIGDLIAGGGSVSTGLFSAFPGVQGLSGSPEEAFDPGKYQVRIELYPGAVLRSAASRLQAKRDGESPGTVISSVTDLKTGSVNWALTPGQNLRLSGVKLKIAGEENGAGLYFVPQSGGAEVRVDPADIVVNSPAEVIAVIPPLPAGVWRVRLVTRRSSSKRPPCSVTFDNDLLVAHAGGYGFAGFTEDKGEQPWH